MSEDWEAQLVELEGLEGADQVSDVQEDKCNEAPVAAKEKATEQAPAPTNSDNQADTALASEDEPPPTSDQDNQLDQADDPSAKPEPQEEEEEEAPADDATVTDAAPPAAAEEEEESKAEEDTTTQAVPTEAGAPAAAAVEATEPARKVSGAKKGGFAAPKKAAKPDAPASTSTAAAAPKASKLSKGFKKVAARPATVVAEEDKETPAAATAADEPQADASTEDAMYAEEPAKKKKPAAVAKPKVAVTKPKGIKKPAAAKTTAATSEASGSQAKPDFKRNKNSYMFFGDAKRAEIKAAQPELTVGEVAKQLGALWKEMSAEEKAPYEAQATADKERYAKDVEEHGPLPKKQKATKATGAANTTTKATKTAAAAAKETAVKAKTGCELFADEQRETYRSNNPTVSGPELDKLLRTAFADLSEEEKTTYNERAKELKKEAAAAAKAAKSKPKAPKKKAAASSSSDPDADADEADQDDGDEEETGLAKNKRRAPARSAATTGRKRAKNVAEGGDTAEVMEEDDDDEEEDEDYAPVSWEEAPAIAILGKNLADNIYLVARQGLPLHRYGEVSIADANLHKSGGGDGSCPLPAEMVQEYEDWCKKFALNVHDCRLVDPKTKNKVLNLSSLPPSSLLEACKFLGDLREEGMELEKSRKNKHLIKDDDFMQVPMMGTCKVVQRVLDVQRITTTEAEKKAEEYKAKWLAAEAELKKMGKASLDGAAALAQQEV